MRRPSSKATFRLTRTPLASLMRIVPYSQNVRLHDALAKAGATNELFTVPGAGHGNFNPEERTKIYLKIKDFLANNGL